MGVAVAGPVGLVVPAGLAVDSGMVSEAGLAAEAEQAEAGVEPVNWGRRLPAAAVRKRHKTEHDHRAGFRNVHSIS